MNAARFARSLVEDGVEPTLAQSLAEHLADEIDRTVATKDHVEMVVTREVQQLRVAIHEEFQRFDARITNRLDVSEPDHAATGQPFALAQHPAERPVPGHAWEHPEGFPEVTCRVDQPVP
jgi:hypothetical protein